MNFFRLLKTFEDWMMIGLFSIMCVVMFIQVIMRYIWGAPFTWGEEIARYSQIWLVYIGACACTRVGRHIRVDILDILYPKSNPYTEIISDILSIAFIIAILFLSFPYIKSFIVLKQTSPAVGIPMAIICAIIPFGFILMFFRFVKKLFDDCKTFYKNRATLSKQSMN